MILETVIGGLTGGLFRLAPEVLKFFDRKNERSHELAMLDLSIKADSLKKDIATIEAQGAIGVKEIDAIIEATKAQGQRTGIKWVDAINSLIRPLITLQWVVLLWPGLIIASFFASYEAMGALEAFKVVFGIEEKIMASSIVSFWFVDRSLRKNGKTL